MNMASDSATHTVWQWLLYSFIVALYLTVTKADRATKPPHILFVLADDLGWSDVGFHGSKLQTPNIDKLASNGVILDNYYVLPICSPTRSALLTGMYPIHTGMQHFVLLPNSAYGLPLNFTTLPQKLKELGLCDICCISECMGLLHLDVRNNNISSLDSLSALKLLETLNISNNNLSTLEGVQELSNLSSLNVAGNIIRSIDSLACLSKLEKLTTLRLQDAVENLSNPVCLSENYKKAVCSLLPKLKTLDGERVSGKGADLYEMCDEMEAIIRVL
ncbi:leucine-rich repeat-containing protein 61-like isoform X2 [Montipora foliosa]|uniref:leucine-rich repeat-containing protein 61-like isoform X2 n=1 Tax=Montipora foliosa TaxID=591990 RepID=UPI0035F1C3F5